MDSFFKAAVCDLDKLLDDFELNTDEVECKSVFLKPPSYPFSSLGPHLLPSEGPSAPHSLPDLSSLHYGSTSCSTSTNRGDDVELAGRPITGVDLLSSVDRRPALSSAPPCPDRALKPVCDLVNDTSSAIFTREMEKKMEEEEVVQEEVVQEEVQEEKQEDEEEELLVDFDSPVQQSGTSCPESGYSAALSLLDVILPAAVERSCDAAEAPPSPGSSASSDTADITARHTETTENSLEDIEARTEPAAQTVGLSCLPIAVSMCGALVNQSTTEEESANLEEAEQSAEAHSLLAKDAKEDICIPEAIEKEVLQVAERRPSPEGQQGPAEPPAPADCSAETSPLDPPEFGFEYLPESDQAELLVTDEELDAFLQEHAESERRGGCCAGSEPEEAVGGGDCGQEELACPESDRTLSCPEQQLSYGGARPKHCQNRSLAGGGGEEEEEEEEKEEEDRGDQVEDVEDLGISPGGPSAVEQDNGSPVSPSPAEEPPDFNPSYVPSEPEDLSVGYDELSEPPGYPGEPIEGAIRPPNCRSQGGEELGSRQPAWVPDSEAPNCMNCYQRFTFTKRRHHCRACGKVYCAVCCNRRCKLKYLEKEARVCITCFDSIQRAQALERMMSPTGPSPNPNVPSEYCSTIPPLQQARAAGTLNSPPPTVMVPVSALKHPSNDGCPREQKRVWFADGILPNGEVADTARLSVTSRRSSQEFGGVSPEPTAPGSVPAVGDLSAPEASGTAAVARAPLSGPWDYALLSGLGSSVNRVPSLLPDNEDELPPLLISTAEEDGEGVGDVLVEESPAPCQILHLLEEGGPRPLTFVLNANLLVNVKLVTYCSKSCWCFGSVGLQALGQKELVFVLECLPEEKSLPKEIFSLYLSVYQDAQRGKFLDDLDNMTFTSSFLGSKDHGGMLFFSATSQPLEGLALPPQHFLFGILVQKLEVPWAKVFPLRLLLRLGAEYNMYPCPLMSIRFRESVYRETGHTIMNLLADLRNYQYSLSVVDGLRIHMEMGHSYIDIPKSSFNEMQKVVNAANEHVISIGARFSSAADSHLVCFQNEEGNYQTQANSMPGKTRTVTGASFVVFNGALKASSGFIAKSSIVEDGLMVQIPPETMEALRTALREQNDFHIPCGKNDGSELRENVTVRWVDWSSPVNAGRISSLDRKSLDGVHSVRTLQDTEFESANLNIRCTEVFYQMKSSSDNSASPVTSSVMSSVMSSCAVFQKEMIVATCSALTPHLSVLTASGINSLSLRISTQADMVEYQAGSGGRLLPQRYMNEMDSALIPVIHGGGASVPQSAMDVEFSFYITHVI